QKCVRGYHGSQQGKLRKEVLRAVELAGECREGVDILPPRLVVRKLALHVVVVNGERNAFNHRRGCSHSASRSQLRQGVNELLPGTLRFGRRPQLVEE